MSDPLTAGLIVTLAAQEFIKSGAGEFAKRFTAEASKKIPELWGKIKARLTGKSHKVNEALANVEKGDSTAIETITKNLDVVLDEDPDFAQELQDLAQEIKAGEINYNSQVQNQHNYDGGTGFQSQAKDQATVNNAQNQTINYHYRTPPEN